MMLNNMLKRCQVLVEQRHGLKLKPNMMVHEDWKKAERVQRNNCNSVDVNFSSEEAHDQNNSINTKWQHGKPNLGNKDSVYIKIKSEYYYTYYSSS